jgi:hypothetical protein
MRGRGELIRRCKKKRILPVDAVESNPSQMKLLNAPLANVPERKITQYLLNPAHPAGGSKARFFLRFGFTAGGWQQLAEALRRHGRENEVAAMEQTAHGSRYIVDRPLIAPDGSRLNVRSA